MDDIAGRVRFVAMDASLLAGTTALTLHDEVEGEEEEDEDDEDEEEDDEDDEEEEEGE